MGDETLWVLAPASYERENHQLQEIQKRLPGKSNEKHHRFPCRVLRVSRKRQGHNDSHDDAGEDTDNSPRQKRIRMKALSSSQSCERHLRWSVLFTLKFSA
jgi:hypothetical protein